MNHNTRIVMRVTNISEEIEMKQNNMRRKLKAIVAVVLAMVSLFTMSSIVNAGFVELILGEDYEFIVMTATSSSKSDCVWNGNGTKKGICSDCKQTRYEKICTKCRPAHTKVVCGCPNKN